MTRQPHAAAGNDEYPLVYRNLMVVALLGAVHKAKLPDLDILNQAVEATLADPRRFRLYRAFARGVSGDSKCASEMLAEHLEADQDDDGAKVTLAIAMLIAGDKQWKGVIDNVLALSTDIPARTAAWGVLEFVGGMVRK